MTNKLTFDPVPDRTDRVRHIGSLVFDMRTELGSSAYLDLTGINGYELIARECIAALYEHARPGVIGSELSLGSYGTAIRELLAYCATQDLPQSIRLGDLTFEFLLDYRAHIKLTYSAQKSDLSRRRFGNLLRLLEAAKALGLAPRDSVSPRNFIHARDGDRTQPYTAGELIDLEDACRSHIRELAARLALGRQLLEEGSDPRGRPARSAAGTIKSIAADDRKWNQLPNLLWYVVNVMDGQCLKREQLLADGHSSFNSSIMGTFGGKYRKTDVYSHLYALTEDLIPYVLLLAKTTGRNESSILGLRRDCLREVGGRHILSYEKDRGAARSYTKVIPNDGPFSPVQLIRQLSDLTEPLVRFAAPDDQHLLLLGLTLKSGGRKGGGLNPVKRLDPTYFKAQMNGSDGWCVRRGLRTENGEQLTASMRRLRVNYLTYRYRTTGQLAKVTRDAAHTMSSTTVPYIDNDATKHIHEGTVERAIQKARALASPVVIPPSSAADASRILGVDAAAAERILSGSQDVFFASCRDFYNRPGGQPNKPCDQAWGCLSCSNAVITTHVLPRLVKFRDFVDQQREHLTKGEWDERFGMAARILHQDIFPSFSAEALAQAERLACDEILYVPLNMKG